MVRIALVGGSGNVAGEVFDALLATGRHEILVLSRKDPPAGEPPARITWTKTDYQKVSSLVDILSGVHTVLCFITTQTDPDNVTQKRLIYASVLAGVKRFAPSEWATSDFQHMSWYGGKEEIRQYLRVINKEKKVLEYSLFVPGLFTNYLAHPYSTAKHFESFEMHIDFLKHRALVLENGEDDRITLTTVHDLANIVVKAVEYEGKWPVFGGIKGTELTIKELIEIGESVRGKPFSIERLRREDLEAGHCRSSWLPIVDHPGMESVRENISKIQACFILGISAGSLNTTDEWNRIFPEYEFTSARKFLEEVWAGKP